MNKFNIREANFQNLSRIQVCNKECLPLYYNITDYYSFFIMPKYNILMAEDAINGKLCGFLVSEHIGKYYHILTFGVNKQYRRKGIGSKLIDGLIKIAKCENLSLNVHIENTSGIAFYQKYGFKKVTELKNYYNGSLKDTTSQDAVRMEFIAPSHHHNIILP
jgi:ribosomal protein S18 acetylase RimI-like enzyme